MFESTTVDVARRARSDSTSSPGGIGPCHHTNVGRSVTSSESTALGRASRRAVRKICSEHTCCIPPPSQHDVETLARTPSVPAPATIARSGRLPPIRSSARWV